MTFPGYVRKITFNKWRNYSDIPAEDINADALADLRTTQNKLSFFRVESEDHLFETIVSFGCDLKKFDTFDYCVFPEVVQTQLKIPIDQNPGITHLPGVADRHYDFENLSAKLLLELALQLKKVGKMIRLTSSDLLAHFNEALRLHLIGRTMLNPELLKGIDERNKAAMLRLEKKR